MKKYSILAFALVLTAAFFTGCGCRNNKAEPTTTMPTVLPSTSEATTPSTRETTQPTTLPPEKETDPSETIDNGNGPLETNATAGPDGNTDTERSRSNSGENGMESRSRRMPMG